jgi:hypothetical protein
MKQCTTEGEVDFLNVNSSKRINTGRIMKDKKNMWYFSQLRLKCVRSTGMGSMNVTCHPTVYSSKFSDNTHPPWLYSRGSRFWSFNMSHKNLNC